MKPDVLTQFTPRDLTNFSLLNRLKLRFIEQFPMIVDTDRIPDVVDAVEQHGFGFIRGELPKKWLLVDEDKKPLPLSRKCMLRISKLEGAYHVGIVPAMHVITGHLEYGEYYDPRSNFFRILEHGFHGGEYINTYLLHEDRKITNSMLQTYGYKGDTERKAIVDSRIPETQGDQFKLLLWTGFGRNYSSSSKADMSVFPYGQGTVLNCPKERMKAFIFLSAQGDESQKIQFYKQTITPLHFPSSIPIFNTQKEQVATI